MSGPLLGPPKTAYHLKHSLLQGTGSGSWRFEWRVRAQIPSAFNHTWPILLLTWEEGQRNKASKQGAVCLTAMNLLQPHTTLRLQ